MENLPNEYQDLEIGLSLGQICKGCFDHVCLTELTWFMYCNIKIEYIKSPSEFMQEWVLP